MLWLCGSCYRRRDDTEFACQDQGLEIDNNFKMRLSGIVEHSLALEAYAIVKNNTFKQL